MNGKTHMCKNRHACNTRHVDKKKKTSLAFLDNANKCIRAGTYTRTKAHVLFMSGRVDLQRLATDHVFTARVESSSRLLAENIFND